MGEEALLMIASTLMVIETFGMGLEQMTDLMKGQEKDMDRGGRRMGIR